MIEIKDRHGKVLKVVEIDLTRAHLGGAYLGGAYLGGAQLSGAQLSGAQLGGAYLGGANLTFADLTRAHLGGAYLDGANLAGARLGGAYLGGAYLAQADLGGAYLVGADLTGASLGGAHLDGASLPHFQIPEGELVVWKYTQGGLARCLVPRSARRTGTLIGRKCRCEYALVEEVTGDPEKAISLHDGKTLYVVGATIYPDSYDDDPRVECSHGIHFFLTRKEAEEYR